MSNSFESVTGLPLWFGYLAFFMLGAVIGSFLNVVIHRVPRRESIVFPNSACPKCGKSIKAYDNVPVISWLILRGKCRNCKNPIAARYPGVEILTGIVFALVFGAIGFNAFLPVALIFAATMISLVFIDAEHMILPNVITYPLLLFALAVRIVYPIFFGAKYFPDLYHSPLSAIEGMPLWLVSLIGGIFGGLLGGGSLWLIGELWKRFRGVDAMGLGDVKMMFGVGALLGWRLTFLAIFLGAFSGAIIGMILIARSKDKDFQAQIPFGIFLGIGSLLSLMYGESLINWYMQTFLPY